MKTRIILAMLMLFSGIHFNFSFPEELLREWNTGNEDMRSFRDEVYLRLYKQLISHSWLLVLLTAASPYYDESLDSRGKKGIINKYFFSTIENFGKMICTRSRFSETGCRVR